MSEYLIVDVWWKRCLNRKEYTKRNPTQAMGNYCCLASLTSQEVGAKNSECRQTETRISVCTWRVNRALKNDHKIIVALVKMSMLCNKQALKHALNLAKSSNTARTPPNLNHTNPPDALSINLACENKLHNHV